MQMKDPKRVIAGLRGSAKQFQTMSWANYQDIIGLREGVEKFHWYGMESHLRWLQEEHRRNSAKARRQLGRVLILEKNPEILLMQEWPEDLTVHAPEYS
jgi:hypothetical protein